MAEARQPQLNGAYYGPSIPPPAKTYHRPGRSRSCYNPCICLFKFILTLAVILGIAALVFWLIVRPHRVRFHVTSATLSEFNYTSTNNNLNYDLALDLTVRNPNRRIGIYYDRIEARAHYRGERFDSVQLPRFYQGHRNTTVLHPVFRGQNVVMLRNSELSAYNSQRSSGVYYIDVTVHFRIRFRVGSVRTPRVRPRIECDLRIPLATNGRSSGSFETTRCGIDW